MWRECVSVTLLNFLYVRDASALDSFNFQWRRRCFNGGGDAAGFLRPSPSPGACVWLACARTRRSAAALRMCAAGTGLRADGTARLAAHAARELTCGVCWYVLALDAKGLNQANPPHLVQCGGGASTGGDDTTWAFALHL